MVASLNKIRLRYAIASFAMATVLPAFAFGMTGKELANSVRQLTTGPVRDAALLEGVKHVDTSDVTADIDNLNLAYNTKLEVTVALLAKTPNLSASDLATVAKECVNEFTRDQILLKGISSIVRADVEGVCSMAALATKEKINVVLSSLPKIENVSARDFGTILKSISDGPTRDTMITQGLSLIKRFDGDGAAMLVERSTNTKVDTALKLISLIPSVTGMDLDKMLAVCSFGMTRDQILTKGVASLAKLTKQEAKSLYSRAYSNKDTVAILLMSKIDDIDGVTVGEMAQLSSRGSTRDLIIAEGLKRLTKIDVAGLISMLKAADKMAEKLAMETSSMLKNLIVDDAVNIALAISNASLKDRFLIHVIDLLDQLDEPGITQLALTAKTQDARHQIVQKGIDKIGDGTQ